MVFSQMLVNECRRIFYNMIDHVAITKWYYYTPLFVASPAKLNARTNSSTMTSAFAFEIDLWHNQIAIDHTQVKNLKIDWMIYDFGRKLSFFCLTNFFALFLTMKACMMILMSPRSQWTVSMYHHGKERLNIEYSQRKAMEYSIHMIFMANCTFNTTITINKKRILTRFTQTSYHSSKATNMENSFDMAWQSYNWNKKQGFDMVLKKKEKQKNDNH